MDLYQQMSKRLRKEEDILKGRRASFTMSDMPQRGDFRVCRELDKRLLDYRRFKSDEDRKKINNEYFGIQKEYREKLMREEARRK